MTSSSFINNPEASQMKIQNKRPAARDGHTGVMFFDLFIVFGGDRHHMPFNDLYILDMKRELIIKSHVFH